MINEKIASPPRLPFLLTLLTLLVANPLAASAALLTTKAISESVPQYSPSPIDSIEFKIFLHDNLGSIASVPVFEQTFTESDAGTSIVFDSGPLFDQAEGLLTNGVDDLVTVFVGPLSQSYTESAFFGLAPDFNGNRVTSVVANLDMIQITPLGQAFSMYVAQLDFSGSMEVHGRHLPEPTGYLLALVAVLGVIVLPLSQWMR